MQKNWCVDCPTPPFAKSACYSVAPRLNLALPSLCDTPLVNTSSPSRIIQDVSLDSKYYVCLGRRITDQRCRATELTVQSERAYQKQPHIFQNAKVRAKSARPGKGGRRWYKEVGLGFRTPKTAIEGSYIGTCDMIWSGFVWGGRRGRLRWHQRHDGGRCTAKAPPCFQKSVEYGTNGQELTC